MQEFRIKQLINEPPNFSEHSATLIDLILVCNEANTQTSGGIDTFIPDQIIYHYGKPSIKSSLGAKCSEC